MKGDNEIPELVPVELNEFQQAMGRIASTPASDTTTREGVDALRFGSTVPVLNLAEIEENLFFGTYKGIYTGHSYENTAKGIIPHDSVSLRTFYFLAYWSKDKGRVYIGTQYLGPFGDYTGLKNTITRAFANRKGLEAHSFRKMSSFFQKVEAKEIAIEYMRRGVDAGAENSYRKGATVVLKRRGDKDGFAEETRRRLFSVFDSPKDKVRTAVAKILREDLLIAVQDEDILNCTVLAEVDGSDRRYHFIGDSNFATAFPVSVGMSIDGHPDPAQLQAAMRELLKNEILVKTEHV